MLNAADSVPVAELADAAKRCGVLALVLFGSRARDAARPHSDWDFAVLGADTQARSELTVELTETLQTDRFDLVALETATGVLRHRVSAEGRLLYEEQPGTFERFRIAEAQFYCDVAPVLQRAHADLLDRLGQ